MKNNTYQNRNKKPDNRRQNQPRLRIDFARQAAALLLIEVLEKRKTLDEAMAQTVEFNKLMGRDRAFCANVVKSTLRYLGVIDIRLSQFLQNPLPDTAFFVRAILRISMGQFFANIAPIHSIIDTAVELSKSQKISFGMKGLVNAVLRRATTAPRDEFDVLDLFPTVWRMRLLNQYGEENTIAIAKSTLNNIGIDFSAKSTLDTKAKETLAKDFDGVWIENSLRVRSLPDGFADCEFWQNGDIWIQNAAAAIPAKIIKSAKGENILDMCAAPGGKTLQLCDAGANVTAVDINANRLKQVHENLARTKMNADVICGDAIEMCGNEKWDKILLDAPCSATGTLRRNPESLWIKNPTDLPKFLETQKAMVKSAALGLKKGGILVYAVCSLEIEEGEIAIATALENGLKLVGIAPNEIFGLKDAISQDGTIRILPNMLEESGGLDGFFIAKFIKA